MSAPARYAVTLSWGITRSTPVTFVHRTSLYVRPVEALVCRTAVSSQSEHASVTAETFIGAASEVFTAKENSARIPGSLMFGWPS